MSRTSEFLGVSIQHHPPPLYKKNRLCVCRTRKEKHVKKRITVGVKKQWMSEKNEVVGICIGAGRIARALRRVIYKQRGYS